MIPFVIKKNKLRCFSDINCSVTVVPADYSAEKIIKLTNSESDIQDIGNHELYPMRGTLDISRAKDLLNYEPQFTLDQGLQSYYDWLQNKI